MDSFEGRDAFIESGMESGVQEGYDKLDAVPRGSVLMSESDSAAATFGWIGERFGAVVAGVIDWDAATPVPQWQARDVVSHLTEWIHVGCSPVVASPGSPRGPSVADDPVAAWTHRAAEISAL